MKLNTGRYGHVVVNNGKHIFVIGGSGKQGILSDIEIIDPVTNKVVQLKDKLIPRRYHSAVWDKKDSIYILGGITPYKKGARRERRVEVYDIPSQQVSVIGNMPNPKRNASAEFKDGKIFYMGGSHHVSVTSNAAIYNIAEKKWRLAADMPTAKETDTVQTDTHIYAIGGYYQTPLNVLERYSFKTQQWQSLAHMPQELSAHSSVIHNKKILTFGDYNKLGSTHEYNIDTQDWQKVEIGYLPSRHNSATVLNNKIYVIGGNIKSSGSYLNYIQVFEL